MSIDILDTDETQSEFQDGTLTHEITGDQIKGKAVDGGVQFDIPATGAWKMA